MPTDDAKRTITPKLRFPEFRSRWTHKRLGDLAEVIEERAGDTAGGVPEAWRGTWCR